MFQYAENAIELSQKRKFETKDIAKRIGVISPDRIHIRNYLVDSPITAFNPAMVIKGDIVYLFPRAILGYFMYVSAILKMEIPVEDLSEDVMNFSDYSAEIVVYPSIRYDLWGTEDPRVVEIDGRVFMVYVGRGINYFNPSIRYERTLPIVAEAVDKRLNKWEKKAVLVLDKRFRKILISDKDAFIIRSSTGDVLLFHRPHMMDERYYLTVSIISRDDFLDMSFEKNPVEIEVKDTKIMLEPQGFEIKLGWAAPPIEIERDTYLILIHGIDNEIEGYRVFAAMIKYDKDTGPRPIAVTPHYIMEPKALYEIFGDRPYVVFPCGNAVVDDKLIIAYGAADYAIGFAEIPMDVLMSELDKTTIE
ncbi:MAG: glycosidase [Thermoplasmata archaeon]|nr:glycosidase [Euryarchaeota archaeon]RLF67370.1 MAG: glycosidase [Thermoplasmata archaeon]